MSKFKLYILISLGVCLILPLENFYIRISLFLFIIEFLRFILSKNILPIKEITSLLMVLQLLLAPAITYSIFHNISSYPMSVDDNVYFKFIIPSYLLFLVGLYLPFRKNKIENPDKESLYSSKNFKIGIVLVSTSLLTLVIRSFINIPYYFAFIFILLGDLIFVGSFYIFFSNNRYRYLFLFIFYSTLAGQTIAGAIFINLFIWSFFIFSLFAYKYNFSIKIKLLIISLAFFLAFLVQSFKKEYRNEILSIDSSEDTEIEIFTSMAYEKVTGSNSFFSFENIDKFISRLNQGWILSRILDRMPDQVQFANGSYLWDEIQGILLPRLFFSEKAVVGSHDKFEYFTGIRLLKRTAMNVGIFGDGYGNFGYAGNLIFSFLFACLINFALFSANKLGRKYPTFIFWMPFIFFYVMRAGNEFYIIVNWAVKSSLLVWLIFYLFKNYFIVKAQREK